MGTLLTVSVCLLFFGIITLAIAAIFWSIKVMGIFLLAVGIILMVAGIVTAVIYVYKRKINEQQLKEKKAEFAIWLNRQGFVISYYIKSLLIDTAHSKWCKLFDNKIFNFTDAVSASINKIRSSTISINSSSGGNGRKSSTRTSRDTSTYEVLIKTTDITKPLIEVDCGTDKAVAEKICSIVDIMRGKKTRKRKIDTGKDDEKQTVTD